MYFSPHIVTPPPIPSLSLAQIAGYLDDIVKECYTTLLSDRGRSSMLQSVYANTALAAAIEEAYEITVQLRSAEIFRLLSRSAHYRHRVLDPSKHISRNDAYWELAGIRCELALLLEAAFLDGPVMNLLNEAIASIEGDQPDKSVGYY